MPALDDLPPDQRAVLQMVLQRGRSYDEIANVLSIDRGAVRQRALDGFDALTPATVIPGPERSLVTDYLLGQLPSKVAEQVYAYLQASDADRQWAEAIAAEVAPIASQPLPEIPAGAPLGADDQGAGGLEQDSDPFAPDSQQDLPVAYTTTPTAVAPEGLGPAQPGPWEPHADDPPASRPSSRRGGAILLAVVAVLIVAAVIVVVLSSGNSSPKQTQAGNTTPAPATTTGTTTTISTGPDLLAQLNLTSPTGDSSTVGVAQVIREQGKVGIVIVAQGLPANTTHNAYAVWLYNSPTSFKFVGFVPNLVGKNGKLATEGTLPDDATAYHRLLLTLETESKPSKPGQVALSGPFREHS